MGRIRDVRITGQGILPVAVLCEGDGRLSHARSHSRAWNSGS